MEYDRKLVSAFAAWIARRRISLLFIKSSKWMELFMNDIDIENAFECKRCGHSYIKTVGWFEDYCCSVCGKEV